MCPQAHYKTSARHFKDLPESFLLAKVKDISFKNNWNNSNGVYFCHVVAMKSTCHLIIQKFFIGFENKQ